MSLKILTKKQLEYMECFWARHGTELCKQDLINCLSTKGYSHDSISYMLHVLTHYGYLKAHREGRNF